MIWTSVPVMTAVDLMIISVTVAVLWRYFRTSTSRRPSVPKAGLKLILVGLLVVGLFYFVDLLSMHVLPAFIPMAEAVEVMGNLHRNFSWLVSLFAIAVISVGFMELKRTQEELAEKNQLLEGLSSKLSRYLSQQVYQSIFRGEQKVEISSRRKKLTVFFSDIVGFTETTDNLEPEELTNRLNHYLTEMSKIALEYGATMRSPISAGIDTFVGIPTPLLRITKTHPSVVLGLAAPNLLRSRFRDVSCNSKFFGWFSGVDPSYVGDGRDAGSGDFCLYQNHAL